MDVRLTEDLAALGTYSVRSLVGAVVNAYVAGYRARRPDPCGPLARPRFHATPRR